MKRLIVLFMFLTVIFSVLSFLLVKDTYEIRRNYISLGNEVSNKQDELKSVVRIPRYSFPDLDTSYRSFMEFITTMYMPQDVKIVTPGNTSLKMSSNEWKYGVMRVPIKIIHIAPIKESLIFVSDIESMFPVNLNTLKHTSNGYEIDLFIYGNL